VQPIFFGKSGQQLFGVYHPPLQRRSPAASALLCYPAVQEYMRTHWAFRKLAAELAREGVHVLRFDYHGTGDSSGAGADGSVARWVSDVATAAAELADLSDVARPSLIGLRLGAALAVLAAQKGLKVKDLVLWEPAVDGASHLAELAAIEKARYDSLALPSRSGPEELFGYELPGALRAELEAVDLRNIGQLPADRVLVVAGAARPEHEALAAVLRDRAGQPPEVRIAVEDVKDPTDGVMLSSRAQLAIAAAVTGGVA
jgi:pimeloyl-ACP methyl ester carboxylesterase